MALPDDNRLTSVDGVALLRHSTRRAIYNLVEGGSLFEPGFEFVFNIAVDPDCRNRELRFWLPEVKTPAAVAGLPLAQVLARLLPPTVAHYATGHVTQLLLCDYQHLRNLKLNGVLPLTDTTPRTALEKFLTQRLVIKPITK